MITSNIALELNIGQSSKVEAVITPEVFSDIFVEFKASPEWKSFEAYCLALLQPSSQDTSHGPLIEKFEVKLQSIIEKHSIYHISFLWPVIDAMFEQVTGRQPW